MTDPVLYWWVIPVIPSTILIVLTVIGWIAAAQKGEANVRTRRKPKG